MQAKDGHNPVKMQSAGKPNSADNAAKRKEVYCMKEIIINGKNSHKIFEELENTVVHYVNREQFPNRYKGIPYSTQFSMRFYRGTWRIYDIKRDNACGSKEFEIVLSDAAKTEIIKRIEGGR